MRLETERLILRPWEDSDAEDLYIYATDPDVGPITGWPMHKSIDESCDVIKNVLNGPEAYAICLKEDGRAIGDIELELNGHTAMTDRDDECELGFWLGKQFWGRGIMPEAANELLRRAFEDLGMQKVWCGYYDGNNKSRRVQEKCGFKYQCTNENVDVPLMHEKRTEHIYMMTKEDWMAMHRKTIYLAGGCFWGMQKYFDQFDGVVSTEVGYANGPDAAPSYEDVCNDSGHAETVRIVYDGAVTDLHDLLRKYFLVIDPLSVNRQGHDTGIQYRTGIYYTDEAQLPDIREVYGEIEEKAGQKLAVVVEPLKNFFSAEEYHQKYLDKNPGGYCHIPKEMFTLK